MKRIIIICLFNVKWKPIIKYIVRVRECPTTSECTAPKYDESNDLISQPPVIFSRTSRDSKVEIIWGWNQFLTYSFSRLSNFNYVLFSKISREYEKKNIRFLNGKVNTRRGATRIESNRFAPILYISKLCIHFVI